MEQNFQTSFIPKKPIVEQKAVSRAPVGLLTIVSVFIFFAVIIASGGLYFYKDILKKSVVKMNNDLTLAKARFEPSKITQLQTLDNRLKASTEVLDRHTAISPIFQALGEITMKSIRYTKFSYSIGTEKDKKIMVKMSGQSVGYAPIALQSDLFTKNKYFIDPVFSNLTLGEKGNVSFDLEFSVDPTLLDYKQMLQTESTNTTPTENTGVSN